MERVTVTVRAPTGKNIRVEVPRPFPAAIVYVMPAKPNTEEPSTGPAQVRQGDVAFLRLDDAGDDSDAPRYALDESSVPQDDPTVVYLPRHCRSCDRVRQWCFVPPVPAGGDLLGVTTGTPAFCIECYERLASEGAMGEPSG